MFPNETFLALITFSFVSSMTPGPNNIMLAASGVNFGFVRTLPHMAGVTIGFALLLIAAGFGLGALFTRFPLLQTALKVAGVLYLLWLAWRIANSGTLSARGKRETEAPQPLTFWQAAAFQAVNPKALIMAISSISLYVRPDSVAGDVAQVTGVLTAFSVLSTSTWAGFGTALREALKDPVKIRIFNIVMALALVASIIPMLDA
jgi:threonine/homoserine/homoserine lactone efflux protein